MKKKQVAETTAEFDKRFDKGEDITDLVDMTKAKITHPGRKVRITLDVPETLVRDIDAVRQRIGVDRGALIKVWLHERVAKEKAE
jgi:hypothetical protein